MATTPFVVNPMLTAIAIGFMNTEDQLIADRVMPRVPVAKTFNWTRYASEQAYSVPDTRVGRKSAPNEVSFTSDQVTDRVDDFGLDDVVPQDDVDAFEAMPKPSSGGPLAPDQLATMMLTNLVLLDREIRVAAQVQNSANYVAANRQTLTGTDQWNDYVNSDPQSDLLAALDVPLLRPNSITMGQAVWTTLRQHPKLVRAVNNTDQSNGIITRQQLADLLEVQNIWIGNGRLNTAKKGQAPVFARVWGKNVALTYTSPLAAQTFQPTWGWTAQFGTKFAGEFQDPKKGLKGSRTIRVGEQVKEIVAAPDAGYLFSNAIA